MVIYATPSTFDTTKTKDVSEYLLKVHSRVDGTLTTKPGDFVGPESKDWSVEYSFDKVPLNEKKLAMVLSTYESSHGPEKRNNGTRDYLSRLRKQLKY